LDKGKKGKGAAHLRSATTAAYSTSAALCVTDRAGVKPQNRSPSSRQVTLACSHTDVRSQKNLPF